jgi:RHS repeat-associated protein
VYDYDPNGNRDQDITNSSGTFDDTTGDVNRLDSDGVYDYEYDDEGNLVLRTEIATGDYTVYEWDHRNRLTYMYTVEDSSTSSFENFYYDAHNQLIYRYHDGDGIWQSRLDASRHAFVYDEGQIVLQFDYAATLGDIPAAGLRHRYLWAEAVDQLLADEATYDGETLWAMTDHQNSVRDVVDDNGTLRKHTQYDSFGRVTDEEYFDTAGDPVSAAHAEAIAQLFGYTGRYLDKYTGLQNNLHRWYDANIGRWLSEDPIGFAAGDANLYRYVGNAATMYVDPAGLGSDPVDFDLKSGNSFTVSRPGDPIVRPTRLPRIRPYIPNRLPSFTNSLGDSWGAMQDTYTALILDYWDLDREAQDFYEDAYNDGPLGQTTDSEGLYWWGPRVGLGVSTVATTGVIVKCCGWFGVV